MADDSQQKPPIESEGNATSPSGPTQKDGKDPSTTVEPPPIKRQKPPDNDHGNRFQSKLLFLFFIRAINQSKKAKENNEEGYKFQLATELEEYGGKFDDLVFLKDYGKKTNRSFVYLQAKHKQNEMEKITASDLLTSNDRKFSLTKYFHSYRDHVMEKAGDKQDEKAYKRPIKDVDSVDCVICTNANFDEENLKDNKIKLTSVAQIASELLFFKSIQRPTPTIPDKVEMKNFHLSVYIYLRGCAKDPTNPPDPYSKEFQSRLQKLMQDNGIVSSFSMADPMTFQQNFKDDVNLSKEAQILRRVIVKLEENDNWKDWTFSFDRKKKAKEPTCYRLEPIRWLEMHYVANVLRDCAPQPKSFEAMDYLKFKRHLQVLTKERVLVSTKKKEKTVMRFHQDFINGKGLTEEAKRLRTNIDELVKNGRWTIWTFALTEPGKQTGKENLKESEGVNMESLAENLLDWAIGKPTIQLDQQKDEFKRYQDALITENVIEFQTKAFHNDFISDAATLTEGAKALRNIITTFVANENWKNWIFAFKANDVKQFRKPNKIPQKSLDDPETKKEIEDFFNNKLVFAVDTPNEEELNEILKEEVGDYFGLLDDALLYPFLLVQSINFFKKKENGWLSGEEAEIILEKTQTNMDSFCATALSKNYRKELSFIQLLFNKDAKEEMAEKLKSFIDSSNSEKLKIIATPSPKFTAVKVIEAIESISAQFKCDDSFLVTSSSRLQKGGYEKQWIENALKTEANPQPLVIVVCDDDNSEENENIKTLISKKKIVIRKKTQTALPDKHEDTIIYKQLSEDFKTALMDTKVSFQGTDETLGKLIESNDLEKVNSDEFSSMLEELLKDKVIISCDFSTVPGYINRKLKSVPCESIPNQGSTPIEENELIEEDELIEQEIKTIVIFGMPGSGKSTLMSKLYQMIKYRERNYWVILIDLANCGESLIENFASVENITVSNFVEHLVEDVRDSPFKKWLLKNRLETIGDRDVVLMFDGLHKISNKAQQNAFQLFTFLRQLNLYKLFIASRWDNFEELHNMCDKFIEIILLKHEQQTNCVTNNLNPLNNETISRAYDAIQLILGHNLERENEECELLGLPLHCKILAKWISSKNNSVVNQLDIIVFYNYLITEIKNVNISQGFEPKNKGRWLDQLAGEKNANDHYHNLSIDTVFGDVPEKLLIIFPYSSNPNAPTGQADEKEKIAIDSGLDFGLTYRNKEGDVRFIHKSLADFFIAQYLYEGFHLEDKKQSQLLDKPMFRNLIVNNILVEEKFETVRMFLNLMLEDVVWDNIWRDLIANETSASKPKIAKKTKYSAKEKLQMFVKSFGKKNGDTVPEYNALRVAADNTSVSIFVLLLDCIEAMHKRRAINYQLTNAGGLLATFEYDPYDLNNENRTGIYECSEGDGVKGAVKRFLEANPFIISLNCETNNQIKKCFLSFVWEILGEKASEAEKKINIIRNNLIVEFQKRNTMT